MKQVRIWNLCDLEESGWGGGVVVICFPLVPLVKFMLQPCGWDVGAGSDLWKGTGPPQYLHAKSFQYFHW